MYHFYVLRSKRDGKYYFGVTGDVIRRLQEHNEGKNKSTRYRVPFVLVYTKSFSNKRDAYRYEWRIKHNGDTNKQLKTVLAEVAKSVKAPV